MDFGVYRRYASIYPCRHTINAIHLSLSVLALLIGKVIYCFQGIYCLLRNVRLYIFNILFVL